LARRAPGYRIADARRVHDVTCNDWLWAVRDLQLALPARKDRRLALVRPGFVVWFDRQTNQLRFSTEFAPAFDPAGVPSWWNKLVGRAELYHGAANEILYSWTAQSLRPR
jgi:hypothetical protein